MTEPAHVVDAEFEEEASGVSPRGKVLAVGVIQRATGSGCGIPVGGADDIAVTYSDGRTITLSWEHFVAQFDVDVELRKRLTGLLNAAVRRQFVVGRVPRGIPFEDPPMYE